jgi:mono/diheme cytochrome c family protein
MRKTSILLGIALSAVIASQAADPDIKKLPAPAAKTGLTYDADIKPIFEKSCFKCHGPEKQKAKLRVDSLAAVKKGGEDGDVLSVGKSEKSRLVHSVARILDEDENMPPEGKGDPLTKDQVALIRAWIDQGAK